MAKTNRGDLGGRYESSVIVAAPDFGGADDEVQIICTPDGPERNERGFPVTLTLSHDEALKLCADLANRVALTFNPPKRPQAKPIDGGVDLL